MSRPKADPSKPNRPGERLLIAIARHHALSREQTTIAAGFSTNAQSYVDEHMARLTTHGYLQKVLPSERAIPSIYFLDGKGIQFLVNAGVPIDERIHHKPPTGFNLSHRYWTTWVLVRLEQSDCQILEYRNEWQLSRTVVQLTLPSGEKVGYAPDLWTRVLVPGEPEPYSIAWEIDRGAEHQDPWRRKVQEMVAFDSRNPATGTFPFQELFGVETLRYAIAVVPGIIGSQPLAVRARNLKEWTERELAKRHAQKWASVMYLRPMDPSTSQPKELFFDSCWVKPFEEAYQPLMGGSA
jgi:hypothetical protein